MFILLAIVLMLLLLSGFDAHLWQETGRAKKRARRHRGPRHKVPRRRGPRLLARHSPHLRLTCSGSSQPAVARWWWE